MLRRGPARVQRKGWAQGFEKLWIGQGKLWMTGAQVGITTPKENAARGRLFA
jgi:hypothetical protein